MTGDIREDVTDCNLGDANFTGLNAILVQNAKFDVISAIFLAREW